MRSQPLTQEGEQRTSRRKVTCGFPLRGALNPYALCKKYLSTAHLLQSPTPELHREPFAYEATALLLELVGHDTWHPGTIRFVAHAGLLPLDPILLVPVVEEDPK